MKFLIILLVIVSIAILLGLFVMSARLLKQTQQQHKTERMKDVNQSPKRLDQ